jgi:branched-chain amino acid transport system ATP-binding protein
VIKLSLLELDNLNAGYGPVRVLWDLSLTVDEGETVVLVGPNGAGKSTTIRTIVGLTSCNSGRVLYGGNDVTKQPYHRRLHNGIGWIPEGRKLFGKLTVRDNLLLSARQSNATGSFDKRLHEVTDLFPILAERLEQKCETLSGGQQQMVAIARALVREPRLILLDEPSVGLAPSVLEELREAIAHLARQGVATVVAEQNTEWLRGLTGRAYLLQGGRVVEQGNIEILESEDLIRRVFLGVSSDLPKS